MTEHYNQNSIVVSDDAVVIQGQSTAMNGILRAEAYQVENWVRNGVIFVIGCLGPILCMILATQVLLIPSRLDDGHVYSFGPIVLIGCVICGGLAAAIGHYWPKPWGVVVERPEFGHGKLTGTKDKDEAEAIAAAINKVVVARDGDA